MKVLQEQYNLIKEGKGNKAHFLKTAFRLFPDMLSPVNTFEDTVKILKNRSILSENIGGVVTKGTTPDWHKIFKEKIEEVKEAKAEEKEPTKEVTDMETKGYDYKDKKNYDNVFGEEFLKGFYTEMGDPKNEGKTVEELRAIVAKNLAKDMNHYVKDGQFGVKGVGYTTEAPGLGTPKEAKGKHKSSGYGDLKENKDPKAETKFYNSLKIGDKAIYDGPEKNGFMKGDKVEVVRSSSSSTFQKTLTVKKGDKKLVVKRHGSLKPLNESSLSSLKESVLRALISETIKEVLAENIGSEDELYRIVSKYVKDANDIDKELNNYYERGYQGFSDELIANLSRDPEFQSLAQKGHDEETGKELEPGSKEWAIDLLKKSNNTSLSYAERDKYRQQYYDWKGAMMDNEEFKKRLATGDLDEVLTPEDEEEFTRAIEDAEQLYEKTGSVKGAMKYLPKEYNRFKEEIEQHLIQKYEG